MSHIFLLWIRPFSSPNEIELMFGISLEIIVVFSVDSL